ncbi:AarF/UbiB family protein, partial [uncultured Parolsenella sp.]|uniref:ABC1 kinase family protein n=1 Tax=uncultured Parolsenella sp. TaxID=2083008 RepID=UPI0027D93EDC
MSEPARTHDDVTSAHGQVSGADVLTDVDDAREAAPEGAEAEQAMWEAALAGVEGPASPDDDDDSIYIGILGSGRRANAARYGLSRKRRHARLLQIFGIVRKYDVLHGITPVKFRRMLEELGPTFVKAGQILSMRSEILPERFCKELSKLRSDVDPMPHETVIAALEAEYGERLDTIFDAIGELPLGSASVAQVHRARLASGEDVAIKIQRPHVQEVMARDIDIMRSLVRHLTPFFKGDQFLDLTSVVEELWDTFREETDFLVEARNLEEFRRNNEGCAFVACPKPYLSLCTEHVVVMEYVEGISVSSPARLVQAGYDLNEIGTKLVDNYASQLLDNGFFHADPHPGNIVVSGGQIVFLDLGITGRLSPSLRRIMRDMIFSVAERDTPKLKSALLRLSLSSPDDVDHAELLADLDEVVDEFGTVSLSELDLGSFLGDLISLARRNGIELPGQITSMARGLVTLEGVLDEFLPGVNMIEIISQHIRAHADTRAKLERDARELAVRGRAATKGLLGAAAQAELAMSMLTRGQLKLNMDFVGS